MDEIDWWRLDSDECEERQENGQIKDEMITMPQLRISEFGSTRGIYIDRIEIRQEGEEYWDFKGKGQRMEEISGDRYLLDQSLFTSWPDRTPGDRITESEFLATGRGANISFPFAAKPSDVEFEITVYTSVDADEIYIPILGPLPRFLGRIRFKPIKKSYTIVS